MKQTSGCYQMNRYLKIKLQFKQIQGTIVLKIMNNFSVIQIILKDIKFIKK